MTRKISGKFVVIEGIDSCGKKTQTKLLKERLEKYGHVVKIIDFPAYDTEFGSMVARYLHGKYGAKEDVSPEVASLLYALDRYQFKDKLHSYLANGTVLLANRYTHSNLYQAAKLHPGERLEMIRWIEDVERRLPRPDLVIFLHVSPDVTKELIKKRDPKKYLQGKSKDIHECDTSYQQAVLETYLEYARQNPRWAVIQCVKNGTLKKPEEIHEEVWSHVMRLSS